MATKKEPKAKAKADQQTKDKTEPKDEPQTEPQDQNSPEVETTLEEKTEPRDKPAPEPETKDQPEAETKAEEKTEENPQPETQQPAPAAEQVAEPEDNPTPEAKDKTDENAQTQTEEQPEPTDNEQVSPEDKPAPEPDEKLDASDQNSPDQQPETLAQTTTDNPDTDTPQEPTDQQTSLDQNTDSPISETIRKMTQSTKAALDGTNQHQLTENTPTPGNTIISQISAKDIMQTNVAWISPEDSVQDALTILQQNDAGYLMVGTEGKLEGIVSRSDINGALSPYLQPIFAKWRRPLDDATLQIKIKWIMTRTIRTVKADTPLAVIMENMCQFGWRALPVIDDQGNVQGLVTVFDIFRALLKTDPNTAAVGKNLQAPMLA
jgi:CBS domain-containing protein